DEVRYRRTRLVGLPWLGQQSADRAPHRGSERPAIFWTDLLPNPYESSAARQLFASLGPKNLYPASEAPLHGFRGSARRSRCPKAQALPASPHGGHLFHGVGWSLRARRAGRAARLLAGHLRAA